MEKKEKSSKLISSLVALSLATTLGVPTIALADTANAEQPTATQQQTTGISTTTVTEGDAQGEETTPPQETKTVAMVGKEAYSSLQEAINEASNGATIELTSDIDECPSLLVAKNLTINFGQYTVTGARGVQLFTISGNVVFNGTTGGVNGGAGGNNTAVTVTSGVLTINGGNYTVGGDAAGDGNSTVYVYGSGKATINGGHFSSEKPYDDKYYVLNVRNQASGSIEVKGGTFEGQDPSDGDDVKGDNFVAQSFYCATKGNIYSVYHKDAAGESVAQVGGNSYRSIQEAVDEAPSGSEVKVLADANIASPIIVTKQLTLNADSKTISNTADLWYQPSYAWSLISVRESGDLTITGDGVFKAKENDCYAVDVQDATAKVVIQSGTFNGNITAVYVYSGSAVINGGTFLIQQLNSNNVQDEHGLTINCFDSEYKSGNAKVSITGGTFNKFDPASNRAEGEGTNFLASSNYYTVKDGDNYVVKYNAPTPTPSPTTETTTTTNPDGTTTTTVTNKETGESTSTTEGANGTTVVEKTDASGNTTTDITVPEEAVDAAAGAPVEVPDAIEVAESQEISISAPAGTVVAVPVTESNAGNVAVIVHADGTETVIPMSLVEDGKAIVQLDGNETIKIVDNAKEFTDVADDYWAAGDIDFASSHEIFKGIGNGNTYEPETALTRNMMMTVLARTDGADTSDSDPWYAKGQQWAVDNGVSNGLWGEDSITREQLVTMLFNYANKSGMDTSARADLNGMKNADAVSSWALEAVQWAVAEGILKGVDNTDLAPQGLATRAQAAAFMQRYVKAALL
ncbi:S-layer homology domain-containing protein [Ellagibacter isourolithinifaciens]|uniref:S-layer homology domain-containing protein n=1 Tax=Ellagibacter isourolithinifaciens TaxID=2137581 RepID=UPI003A90A2F2